MSAEGRPDPGVTAPPGWELVAVPDTSWIVRGGRPCRMRGVRTRECGQPGVAATVRGVLLVTYIDYCESHMSGRWVEEGQVMKWAVRPSDPIC